MAATSDRLGGLHEMFTRYWEMRMEQAMDPNPETRVGMSAAEHAVVRAFLKDNGVQADVAGNKELEALSEDLKLATKGVVAGNELDDIMSDFKAQIGGTLQ